MIIHSRWRHLLVTVFVLHGCAVRGGAPFGSDLTDLQRRAEVVQTAQAMFDAMAAHDVAALEKLLTPDAVFFSIDEGEASPTVRARTVQSFLQLVSASNEVLHERIRHPEVRIDGDIATLWAPYEFYRGERFSHCGRDAFLFARSDGRWRIAASSYTLRRGPGCK
jgi:ketosteroid isomerase-like protein